MIKPGLPDNEVERLAELYAHDMLDTPADSLFDGVAALAATLCGTPIAAITLLDKDRQWFKAEFGLGLGQTDMSRDASVCGHGILEQTFFEVPDIPADPRFTGNTILNDELKVRFYGGSQLTTDTGATLGMLCVMDVQPRILSAAQQQSLAQLAQVVMALLASGKRNKALSESRALLAERSAELASTNIFLDSMIELIPVAVYLKEAKELRYVRMNRVAEEMMGMTREQLIGKNASDIFGAERAVMVEEQDRQVMANNPAFTVVDQTIPTSSGMVVLHTSKVPVFNPQGELTHVLGIAEDVTRQAVLQQEILDLNEALHAKASDLEAINKSLEVFSAAATHDLRSPLGVIAGYAGLLQKKYGPLLDAKGNGYLSIICGRAKSMAKLIDDLLAFSRLGHRGMHKTDVDMQRMVESVVREVVPAKGPAVKLQVGLLPAAQADGALLRQVWVNLLSNAVKYSSRATNPRIEVSGRVENAEVIYTVCDNGAGFDMANYDKLFEVFQRLHTDQEFEGTGVGLPIVHGIVTQHGGRVWAEGKVGHGAVFYFTLPVERDTAQALAGA